MKSIRTTNPRLLVSLLTLSCAVAACSHDAGEALSSESSAVIHCPSPAPVVNLGDLPLTFAENQGQSPEEVQFQGVALGAGTLAITADGVRLDLADFPGNKPIPAASVVIQHQGATLALGAIAGSELESTTTFITATGTHSQVPNHAAIGQEELYPGIGVQLGGTSRMLVTTYTVDPGASAESIKWSYTGATGLSIDAGVGSVSVVVAGGARTLSLGPVAAHQVIDGKVIAVSGHYLVSDGVVSVALDEYDDAAPVVITTRLLHSPVFEAGGTTAANGRTYAVGRGYRADSSEADTHGDAYVAVVDDATGQLASTTFVIGEGDDEGHAVAVTKKGGILVAGSTRSLAFPGLDGVQSESAGGLEGFVISLDGDGATLVHGTYLGAAGDDAATGITEAPGGDILVASTTSALASAVNASLGSFAVTLPPKGPSAPTVPYTLTALGASLSSVKYRVPFTGPRIRRPRAWIDCNGRTRFGLFNLMTTTCTSAGNFEMYQRGQDYAQDQPSAIPGGGTTFGWGFHALRWKYFLVNNQAPVTSTTLSWAPFGNGSWVTGPGRAGAPQVVPGSGLDDPHQLNQFENPPVPAWALFSPSNPRGDWEGGDHDTVDTLAIKAALIEATWHSPVYISEVSYDLQGNGYTHATVIEQTLLDECYDPITVPNPPAFGTLCHMPAVADWWGDVDCAIPGVPSDVTFQFSQFKTSTWGELSPNPTWFHQNATLPPASAPNAPNFPNSWYEPGNLVYDPPAGDLQANQKLDEAAARLASRLSKSIAAQQRDYADGVAGSAVAVTVTARALDLR